MITILLLLIGLGLVVLGADWLVEGASGVARRFGMSEFVIGLIIAGFGSSSPELVVSLTGALAGNADIAVGNVIGSNIFNTLLVLGLTTLLRPVAMSDGNRRRDVPQMLAVTVLLLGLGMSHRLFGLGNADTLMRWEGLLMLGLFVGYLVLCLRRNTATPADGAMGKQRKLLVSCAMAVAGLASLIFGGDMFVDAATAIAKQLGVSDKFIAITILAGGTSLPELATSLMAVAKRRDQLALGNVIGSNVFNILLILGSSALITPLSFGSVTLVDAAVLLLSAVLLLVWTHTGHSDRVDRWEGTVMIAAFVGYYIWLFGQM